MRAQMTSVQGERLSVGGFMAVSRAKLRALSGDTLQALAKTDELELLYLHLYSLQLQRGEGSAGGCHGAGARSRAPGRARALNCAT